jgi:hypothetical protein
MARIRIEQGRYEEARDVLAVLRMVVVRQGRMAALEGLGAMQLAAAAGCVDWEDFEHRLGQIDEDPGHEVGENGRWAMAIAADLADAAGFPERADRARSIAGIG